VLSVVAVSVSHLRGNFPLKPASRPQLSKARTDIHAGEDVFG